jgi:phosphoglycolate phosphatase
MKTAIAAEMYPVGALWGFRTENELLSAGAQQLISEPIHLLGIIHTRS